MSPRRSLALSLEMGINLRFGESPFPRSPNVPYSFVLYSFPEVPFGRERSFLLCSLQCWSSRQFSLGLFPSYMSVRKYPPIDMCILCNREKPYNCMHTISARKKKKGGKNTPHISHKIPFFFHTAVLMRTYLRRGDIFRDASEFDCRLFSVKWAFPPPREKNLSRSFYPPFSLHLFSRMKDKEG